MEKNNIGKLALIRDVWYQVLDCRTVNGEIEYKLYTREGWVPGSWIKDFKERTSKDHAVQKAKSDLSQENRAKVVINYYKASNALMDIGTTKNIPEELKELTIKASAATAKIIEFINSHK